MRRVGPHTFTEIYFAGCNPSFVETSDGYVMIDTPQQPIDAVRWREMMEEKAPIRYLDQHRAAWRPYLGQRLFPERAGGRPGQAAGMLRPLSLRVRHDRGKARAA